MLVDRFSCRTATRMDLKPRIARAEFDTTIAFTQVVCYQGALGGSLVPTFPLFCTALPLNLPISPYSGICPPLLPPPPPITDVLLTANANFVIPLLLDFLLVHFIKHLFSVKLIYAALIVTLILSTRVLIQNCTRCTAFFFFFFKVYDTRHSLDTEHHTGLGEYFCSRWWSTQILKYQCFSCTASRVSNSKPKVWYLLTANGNMVSNSSCTSRFILDALFLASLSASGSRLADRTHHVVECQNERNGHPEMTTSHFTSDSVFKCASEFTGFSGTPS